MEKINKLYLLSILAILFSGCSSYDISSDNYNSTEVYNEPIFTELDKKLIAYEGVERKPIIFIHGFLGSKLFDLETKKNVWGDFKVLNAIWGYSDKELQGLSYPMELGKPLAAIKDEVVSTGIMSNADVSVAGFDIKINAYNEIIDLLSRGGYSLEGAPLPEGKHYYSLFVFHYDWRKDLVQNSADLHKFILEKKNYMQNMYKKYYGVDNYNVKFDFVAHSMGGLLIRYYLRYGDKDLTKIKMPPVPDWKGAEFGNKIIIIGTPNTGYLGTFYELLKGYKPSSVTKAYPPAVTGTWATYYEMLPFISTKSILYKGTDKVVDIFDPEIWEKYKWGLANPEQDKYLKIILPNSKSRQEREAIALDHLTKCLKRAKMFTDALAVDSIPPENLTYFLLFGNAVETKRRAFINENTGEIEFIENDSGDGIVCTSSALFDLRTDREWQPKFKSPIKWYAIYPQMAAHMGITESMSSIDDLGYILFFYPLNSNLTER